MFAGWSRAGLSVFVLAGVRSALVRARLPHGCLLFPQLGSALLITGAGLQKSDLAASRLSWLLTELPSVPQREKASQTAASRRNRKAVNSRPVSEGKS